MNKKELKRSGKGLLALMLAFMMMFGSSMTVFAKEYVLSLPTRYDANAGKYVRDGEPAGLKTGQTLGGGDIIRINSGSLVVMINDECILPLRKNVELPAGYNYQVKGYSALIKQDGEVGYDVELISVPITPSGSTESTGSIGNTGTESNNDATKSKNISPELSEEEQYIARLRSEYWENHVHTFSWVTTREATAGQDGIQENRCSCGLVQDTTVIPASQTFVQEYYDVVRNAPANGTVSYDSGSLHTLSDKMLKYLSERSDVAVEVSFVYQGTAYKMTIPAGCDYSALLSDEDAFYGYFYFAQQTGAKIEPVA
ncbi:MAG TPA: hypothetical protein DCW90_24200 [Lachnospiraceae bacterium]|nr:hypothetical protein [Lachnospiraceae bacterium]